MRAGSVAFGDHRVAAGEQALAEALEALVGRAVSSTSSRFARAAAIEADCR